MRGEGRGGFLLGRFYFSKWLTFPVLGHKKVLVIVLILFHEQFGIVSRVVFEQNNHRQYPDHEVSHSHLKLLAKTKELRHIDWQADKIFLNSDVFCLVIEN